ncbi:MAG: HEPN domain-containing protein [Deltaproteobacteria bacterium]
MKDKAIRNFEAAKLLASVSFYDSAASRAYYSAYLFAWDYLAKLSIHPQTKSRNGISYWGHRELQNELHEIGIISPDQKVNWEILYSYRVRADYYEENNEEEDALFSVQIAYDFKEFFLNEERRLE